jgi:hypothetical protein
VPGSFFNGPDPAGIIVSFDGLIGNFMCHLMKQNAFGNDTYYRLSPVEYGSNPIVCWIETFGVCPVPAGQITVALIASVDQKSVWKFHINLVSHDHIAIFFPQHDVMGTEIFWVQQACCASDLSECGQRIGMKIRDPL